MNATEIFDEITVFGARGHSMMLIRGQQHYWQGRVRIRALIDDVEHGFVHSELGVPVISSAERLRNFAGLPVLLTPGSGSLRSRIMTQLVDEGATLATSTCRDQNHVDPTAEYGAGCFCAHYTRIGPATAIGKGAQVLANVIGHDVSIGEFSTLAIESVVAGHVQIGNGVNIAPRAVIANGRRDRPLRIGDGAEIGTGAVVVGDVAAGERVIGNPAMPIRDWVRLRRLARRTDG